MYPFGALSGNFKRVEPEKVYMKNFKRTGYIVAAFVAAIFGVDVWLALDSGSPTISEWIWKYSSEYIVIPFAFGFLAGHLFWNRNKNP